MEKYSISKWPSKTDKIDLGKYGIINRKTLDDTVAERLFKAGFSFIKVKKKKVEN